MTNQKKISLKKRIFFKIFSIYPPFLGAGIRVKISENAKSVDVGMKLKFYNRNYVNTHYGGSLYSMCDPFFMFLLMENLGPKYIVWDKSASIKFKKPGTGRVSAHFHITDDEYERIIKEVDEKGKMHPAFTVEVVDSDGVIVAEVKKVIYIKKKEKRA